MLNWRLGDGWDVLLRLFAGLRSLGRPGVEDEISAWNNGTSFLSLTERRKLLLDSAASAGWRHLCECRLQ